MYLSRGRQGKSFSMCVGVLISPYVWRVENPQCIEVVPGQEIDRKIKISATGLFNRRKGSH